MINNKKGVTMIGLGVLIVVMVILTGVGIIYGVNTVKTAKDKQAYSELLMVQHAVLEQYTKFETTKDISYLLGHKMDLTEVQNTVYQQAGVILVNIPQNYSNKDYYRLDKSALLEMGITDTDDEFIVNYISGEVYNLTQATTSDGNALYVTTNSFN
jgi:Tfp pilus assembly protein PilE